MRLRIKTVLETLNHNPDESVRMKKERERAFLVEMLKQEEAKIKASIKRRMMMEENKTNPNIEETNTEENKAEVNTEQKEKESKTNNVDIEKTKNRV